MNQEIFKLSFVFEPSLLSEYYSTLSEIQKSKVSNLDILASFYYQSYNMQVGYIVISQLEMEIYKKVLDDNYIPYICEEISQKVLNNKTNLEIELENYINFYNSIDYDILIYEVNQWLRQRLTLDSILDRISEFGIETLRPIDREILRSI
jgi:hypothetical protein